jgi:hypothetical protein
VESKPATVVGSPAFVEETKTLLGVLEGATNPVFVSLRDMQFNGLTNEKIATMFEKDTGGADKQALLWGLIKLLWTASLGAMLLMYVVSRSGPLAGQAEQLLTAAIRAAWLARLVMSFL